MASGEVSASSREDKNASAGKQWPSMRGAMTSSPFPVCLAFPSTPRTPSLISFSTSGLGDEKGHVLT